MKKLCVTFFLLSQLSLYSLQTKELKSNIEFCDNKNINFSIDALYWQILQPSMWSYTVTGQEEQNPQVQNNKITIFDFQPGFRANLTYPIISTTTDLRASYTWYQSSFSDTATGVWVTPGFIPGRVLLKHDYYDFAHINWNIQFNIIDLDIGSKLVYNSSYYFRPFLGLKGGWINQTISGIWKNPIINDQRELIEDKENLLNNFSGIGPKIGVGGQWFLYQTPIYHLGLKAEFQTAYLFGHWNIYDQLVTNQPGVSGGHLDPSNRHFGSLMFQGMINMNLTSLLCNDTCRFKLGLGYELQTWLNQYQMLDDLAGSNNLSLSLHGLTFNIGIDF